MSPRPLSAALVAALGLSLAATDAAASTTALPSATTTAEAVVPVPSSGTITVIGKGFGHGRGMSQYGAAGAARAGRTWQEITGFYYPGAARTLSTVSTLRVGLGDSIGSGLRVVASPGLTATDGTASRPLPTTVTVAGAPAPVARFEVVAQPDGTGTVLRAVTANGSSADVAVTAGSWTFVSPDGRLQVTDASGRPGATYLGRLSVVREGTAVQPVLTTRLDDYVRMVVPAESFASWPVQALAAQAVAARTYAASFLSGTRSAGWDICSSQRCQVVGSITAETDNSRQGVAQTAGIVLTSGAVPIRAEFSSSNGGWTVSGGASYLPAQRDPYDRSVINPLNSWTSQVPVSALASAFPAVGHVTGVQVLSRDGLGELGGRVLTARVIGDKGAVTTTGAALRAALGNGVVRSTLFSILPAKSSSEPPSPVALPNTSATAGAAGGIGVAVKSSLDRAVASAPTVRLVRAVGELDGRPGSDAVDLTSDGHLRLLSGTPGSPLDVVGGLDRATDLGGGFADVTAVLAADDLNGDGQRDLLVRRGDGRVERFTSNGRGGLVPGPGAPVAVGWGGFLALTAADVTGDGRDDIVGLLPDGTIRAYRTTGRDAFAGYAVLGRLPGLVDLTSQGDLNHDGRDDLVALDSAGRTWRLDVLGERITGSVLLGSTSVANRLL